LVRKRLALLIAAAAPLAACVIDVPGHLYPVQGPLATRNPAPIYTLHISGILTSGNVSATLGGGESCRGNWSKIPQDDANAAAMSADWDRVYGAGFFTANVLGNPVFARASLSCQQGTTLGLQFYLQVPGQIRSARGVAEDSKGNLYKLTF
jgi:hypothetical protein